MVTQEMYDDGIRCKGAGFNCTRGCQDTDNCVQYISNVAQQYYEQIVINLQKLGLNYEECSIIMSQLAIILDNR